MRDRSVEDRSFQITRDDVPEELFRKNRGPESAPAEPTAATEKGHPDES